VVMVIEETTVEVLGCETRLTSATEPELDLFTESEVDDVTEPE